jgi:hypothetical protein
MRKISYNVNWSKAIPFMLQYDRMGMPYQVFVDRHGRCLIVLLVDEYYKLKNIPFN